jgi:TetR/AcrR family transcriptional regulator
VGRMSTKSAGKRQQNKAALSKEKIINAAISEFASKGLDGARVDEIARRAGVNKMLLYQYVGSKDELFTAALESAYVKIRERQREFIAQKMDPEIGVLTLVRMLMSIWVEHQDYGKLLASENFHGGKHVIRSKLIGEMYQQLVDVLTDLLRRGVAEGVFRENIDPIDLYISMSSLSAYYIAHQHTLNAIFHLDVLQPKRLRQREDHIADMILRFVKRNPDKKIASRKIPKSKGHKKTSRLALLRTK